MIFVYLAILQLVGLVLAFQTRKVKIKVLNDAKFIIPIIYISSLAFVVLIVVRFSLGSYINVREALFSGAILLATTAFVIHSNGELCYNDDSVDNISLY